MEAALECSGPEQIQPSATPALIVAIDDKRIVYFAPGESQPKEVPLAEWAQHFEPVVWALKHNTSVPDQDHPAAQAGRVFGFRWFVPELLKHKANLRDVLIASAALMLMGIGTPLLTQVIFDKVVVHETQSTLMVVTSALAILLVFNALMTWLRQYLVIHTGNRIDAVLGEKVFRHLLRLPMLYFQHRPTGTVMARLHGVETIREFLTGAAVTLLLDFPFMVILLVVMFFYSWELTLIALGILGALITASLIVMPAFRQSLNAQFLPQETILFSGTLYDNLLAATPAASFDDIVASRKAAGIHEFIEQLPKGYQTEVGERGVGLSGGQKQRIAIARALLRRPKIFIFDEARASLDPKTAEQIGKTINQLKGQVTVLFIAHQLPAGLLVDFGVRLGKAVDELGPVAVERAEARQAS